MHCGICVKECRFLQLHGTPGEISNSYLKTAHSSGIHEAYSCNLCGLCESVCPLGLECSQAFLEMRRKETSLTPTVHKQHRPLCTYVNIGSSSLFSLELIPDKCDTIFFPGCTLSATRATTTEKTYLFLKQHIPDLGIVLDCCSKPSRDLGREEEFHTRFGTLLKRLEHQGVKKIVTACPSCYVTLKEYAPALEHEMVYQTLAACQPEKNVSEGIRYTLHDACATRFDEKVHDSIRNLLRSCGVQLEEMKHNREKALCCGEGGAAFAVAPDIASNWKDIRSSEMNGCRVITYCAGCSSIFGKKLPNTHILDLVFFPEQSLQGKEKIRKSPITYLSRLRLKKRLKTAGERETTSHTQTTAKGIGVRLLLLAILISTIAGLRIVGVDDYLKTEELNNLVDLLQQLPPSVFVCIIALAPVLFLPAFPFVISAGILYGQTGGLLYSVMGATLGASLAFFISRYIGSSWIHKKISGSKMAPLHDLVKEHGWKVVLGLRLIPLFPFTPLNYFLGLTGIRFSHYILATIVGILPACTAFIFFSGSLWNLLIHGDMVPVILWGTAFLFISCLPLFGLKLFALENKRPTFFGDGKAKRG